MKNKWNFIPDMVITHEPHNILFLIPYEFYFDFAEMLAEDSLTIGHGVFCCIYHKIIHHPNCNPMGQFVKKILE